ncbi:MAG: GNAT family N-acetyltransferase [Firmicutes bacterium]|nr:GNAT family N-acetyltransferase [Alicyclobacillaceae bacterium]MCL6498121.1 GNAT family N-acetyltransferase [Bacillota bacterium]
MMLETARLRVRPLRSEDLPAFAALMADPAVCRFLEIGPIRSLAELQVLWAWYVHQGRHGVELRETGTWIGTVGVALSSNPFYPGGMVGYELARPYWGQGYMREALGAVIAAVFAERQVHRLAAFVMADNAPSQRLLRRLGFRHEGTLRDFGRWKGGYHTMLVFGLLDSDWDAGQAFGVSLLSGGDP